MAPIFPDSWELTVKNYRGGGVFLLKNKTQQEFLNVTNLLAFLVQVPGSFFAIREVR
jgi:hypothetical protein